MEIFHSLEEAAQRSVIPGNGSQVCASVVTIGSFDGIHLAHQELLRRVRQLAAEQNAASVAITFDPHPVQVLAPQRAPRLLTPDPVRQELFAESGIDRLLILPFTTEFSRWTPEQFVSRVLVDALQATVVVIGDNFRFGHQQAGNPQVMEELGRRCGFRTEILPKMSLRNMTVSSSRIRSLLDGGRISLANRLLGHYFRIRGAIESGMGIGSKQTVPTLNLARYTAMMPAAGVYITLTRLGCWSATGQGSEGRKPTRLLKSVTNVGCRPTFGERELGVETHLLETWEGFAEGQAPAEMEVSFLHRLRDERKFDSPQELKVQILKDIRRAERYLWRLDRIRATK